ncbi:MAG TPA: sulfotransferase [Terriglobales bacterium]
MTREIEPVFIVGTGRCGSTMLSNMIRDHADILSVSEFLVSVTDFAGRIPQAFPEGRSMDAHQVWEVLAGFHPRQTAMLRHAVEMDEMLYPLAPSSRFSRQSGVPAILYVTLPHLTPDHDALFEELQDYVMTFKPDLAIRQYQRVFEWLKVRFGKKVWVERSGGSLRAVPRLAKSLPEAKFVHIVRDGRDCAISMSKHMGFRMVMACTIMSQILGYDPYDSDRREGVEELPDQFYHLLPEHFNAEAFAKLDAPATLFGHYWSGEMMRGLKTLAGLSADRVLTIHFEDILAQPEPWLRRLVEFIDPSFVDEDWVQRAATAVGPVRSSWCKLPASQQSALTDACAPGFQALAAHGFKREPDTVPASMPLFARLRQKVSPAIALTKFVGVRPALAVAKARRGRIGGLPASIA